MEAVVTHLVSWLGAAVFFCLVSFSLAAGLYCLAEYVEEHSGWSKQMLQLIIKVCLALHAFLLLDGLPVLCIGSGVLAHLSYYHLSHHYPFINYKSWPFVGSIVLMVCNQLTWMHHFNHVAHSLEAVLCFFGIVVWLVPFTIFVSMISTDHAPPGCTSDRGMTDLPTTGEGYKERPMVDITAVGGAASGIAHGIGQQLHVRRTISGEMNVERGY